MPRGLKVGFNDLETWCKNNNRLDILNEWDYTKNILKPNQVCYGSRQKIWWIDSKCKHSYEAGLNKRTSDNTGCPYCCKSHAKLLKGFNDLETTNPELLSLWDYDKNDCLPSDVMKGQHKKVWWVCGLKHSYQADIYHIVQGRGCPICRKERQTSFQEQAIYFYIKHYFNDAISNDRKILNGKELDIYIPSKRVAIEFDGSQWHNDIHKDIYKNNLCKDINIFLIRVRDIDCPQLPSINNVKIINHINYTDNELTLNIKEIFKFLEINVDVDLDRDKNLIYDQYVKRIKDKSLLSLNPLLCKEWDYDKNGNLTPDLCTNMSEKKVWWICSNNHSYQAIIHTRSKGSGCPYCNGNRFLCGFNDIATMYPNIIKIIDNEYNEASLTPATNNKKIIYCKCDKKHKFKTSLKILLKYSDDLDSLCPICNPKSVIHKPSTYYSENKQTLDVTNPECLKEWDYEKNIISPTEISSGSTKKVWWICNEGHSYCAQICNHVGLKRGCPYCTHRKVLKGFNDLATTNPEVLQYWDYDLNNQLNIYPDSVIAGNKTKVWWICSKGHKHLATIDSYKPNACPICSGIGMKRVKNIDTGIIYESLTEAAKSCGLKVGDTISLCCKGKAKTAGGYHWKFIEED